MSVEAVVEQPDTNGDTYQRCADDNRRLRGRNGANLKGVLFDQESPSAYHGHGVLGHCWNADIHPW